MCMCVCVCVGPLIPPSTGHRRDGTDGPGQPDRGLERWDCLAIWIFGSLVMVMIDLRNN